MEVGWIVVHLALLGPERIAPKQFADPGFDLEAYLAERLSRAGARLDRAQQVLPALLEP
jgi:hypothetical protein